MRLVSGFVTALAFAVSASLVISAQGAQETATAIKDGGIFVPGWQGKIDPGQTGSKLEDSKLTKQGDGFLVQTGPAVTYWNPANKATGDYTVKATFNEAHYMNRNDHPHPYGIVIAGNDMGTDQNTFLYCEAYGNGTFIVRGFGPAPFQMNGRWSSSSAVNRASGPGEPVTQDIALSVKGNKVECAINGTVVATYDKSALVANGKLKSTDGIYGIRFAHNTEAVVTGLKMTSP